MIVNSSKRKTSNGSPIGHVFRGVKPKVLDRGPMLKFTGDNNHGPVSTIHLSNGVQLDTNLGRDFIMNDTTSGYYFEATGNGNLIFGKDSRNIAAIKRIDSNEKNQMTISLISESRQEDRFRISFLELANYPNSKGECILVQAKTESDSMVLSEIDSYYLEKFSFSMRQILKKYPETLYTSSGSIPSNGDRISPGAALALAGIGLRSQGAEPRIFAIDAHMIAIFLALNPENRPVN
ncbi:MAG: hypothetical protein GY940_33040 [bacterium]|nr:hypothetical protein [bacterium]